MSEVISFRLDKSNKREADAFEILEAWCSKGYSVRHVMIEALLKLGDPGLEFSQNSPNPDLNIVLFKVNKLLEQIEKSDISINPRPDEKTLRSGLADGFLLSIKNAAKPGFKIDS